MICATCGRDNPNHLVFCQECGQRLAPRSAAPSPGLAVSPIGPPVNAFSATAMADSAPPSARASGARPPAPDFEFAPRTAAPVLEPAAVRASCARCGAWNDPGIRFCVTCGNALAVVTAPVQSHAVASAAAISPGRVVPVAPVSTPHAAEIRVCTRCRGACDASSQFCRFCGAPLAGNETTTRPPAAAHSTTDPLPPPPVVPVGLPDLQGLAVTGRPPFELRGDAAGSPPIPSTPSGPVHGGFAPFEEPTPRARLVIIAKDGGEGPGYPIGDTLDIGRTDGVVAINDDRYLSPRHARISRRDGRLYLRDLNSTNGLYLRLRPARGHDGVAGGASSVHGAAQGAKEPASQGMSHGGSPGASLGSGELADARNLSVAHPLKDQDLLLVGQQVLRFEVVNDADEGLGPASQHGTLVFGSPVTPRYARLNQRTVEGVTRDVFYIRKAETVLGRESGDIVFTEDPFLSRRHASIHLEKESRRFLLTDLGSSNGTFVQVRGEITLESGDQFRIGQQLFRVDIA